MNQEKVDQILANQAKYARLNEVQARRWRSFYLMGFKRGAVSEIARREKVKRQAVWLTLQIVEAKIEKFITSREHR